MHGNLIITTVKVNIMGISSNDQPQRLLAICCSIMTGIKDFFMCKEHMSYFSP
jgi:hypothetical protein